jgi:hypothetical protein
MASNNIKYKILSLVTMVFSTVSFSFASIEKNDSYSSLDKFSIGTYCKIASVPFLWFDNSKCMKVDPVVDLGVLKSKINVKAFSNEVVPIRTEESFMNVMEVQNKRETLSAIENKIYPKLKEANAVMYLKDGKVNKLERVEIGGESISVFATSTLHAGNSSFDFGRIVAKEIIVKKLCLEDLCIDKNTLQKILNSSK